MALGWLTAATAVGSVSCALMVAALPSIGRSGAAMLWLLAGFGVALVLFGLSPLPIAAPFFLFLIGAAMLGYTSVHATLMQLSVPDEFRSRVLSTLYFDRGVDFLWNSGSVDAGWRDIDPPDLCADGVGMILCALITLRQLRV